MRTCPALSEAECSDPRCPNESDDECRYEAWLTELEEGVIQQEYGYEPGEFEVFPSLWLPLYVEGLSPQAAFKRALKAHGEGRY